MGDRAARPHRGPGATCIWLSPIFPSPSHHGYDATDYRGSSRAWAREDDCASWSRRPRAGHPGDPRLRGQPLIAAHPAFQEAFVDQQSPKASWFTFTQWPDQYLAFSACSTTPRSTATTRGARLHDRERALLARAGHRRVPLRLREWPIARLLERISRCYTRGMPDSITLGEVVETPALQRSYLGRMDGCLDFLLLQALRQFFAFGTMAPSAFDTFLRRIWHSSRSDFVLPSFLDNHDMNRFLWVVGGDTRRLKLAAICQFTLPHPPIVYYGTEVGLRRQRDVRYADGSGHPEEARQPMRWGQAQDRACSTSIAGWLPCGAANPSCGAARGAR